MKRVIFLQKKRDECGGLSVKMDSRVRGNDEVNAGIPAENKFSIFRKTGNISFPRTRRNSAKKRRHSRESGNLFGEINFGIPANFTRKLSLEFPRIFFRKKRGECGGLSVKMDSRVRGNDGGEAGICRREITAAGRSKLRRTRFAPDKC